MKKNTTKEKNLRTLTVLRDTRENKPFTFKDQGNVIVFNQKLDAGDYSLEGHSNPEDPYSIIIERKQDCMEVVTTIGKNWERFQRQLEKMQKYNCRCIVVHGPDEFEKLYAQDKFKMHPNFIRSRLREIFVKYNIPTYFFTTRRQAESFVYKLFYKVDQLKNEKV